MKAILQKLPAALLGWYKNNQRDLPWRHTKDPYAIWLSEIMLQQTRVEAVKGYYGRFLAALPTVFDLAQVQDETLMKLWEGLGYYTRARNLKKAAQMIVERYDGVFPGEYAQILALPGIGEYTAGAVCSIAFGQKKAAVDGNVLRVVSRLLADATLIDQPEFKKRIRSALEEIYPDNAGDFTQALMELGATVCGPNKAPDCENCPCRAFCLGYEQGIAGELPVKGLKKGRRMEEKTIFILRCDGQYALVKRPEKGLLAGLWQFPEAPGLLELPQAIAAMELPVTNVLRQTEKNHIFTHIEWKMRGFYMEVAEKGEKYAWFSWEEIEKTAALPTAFRQFWEAMDADPV